MKAINLLMMGLVALVASLAVACGDDEKATPDEAMGGGGAGLVRPNTFMTFEGRRYELVNMIFEEMVDADEFQEAGVASGADIELKDKRVFKRKSDPEAMYTFSAATADDLGFWLAWRATS